MPTMFSAPEIICYKPYQKTHSYRTAIRRTIAAKNLHADGYATPIYISFVWCSQNPFFLNMHFHHLQSLCIYNFLFLSTFFAQKEVGFEALTPKPTLFCFCYFTSTILIFNCKSTHFLDYFQHIPNNFSAFLCIIFS